jgi:hypothetical protein
MTGARGGGSPVAGRHQTTSPLRTPAVGRGSPTKGLRGGPYAPPKSNTALYIVIGAGVVVLLLIIAVLSQGSGKGKKPSPGGRPKPKVTQPEVKPPTPADLDKLKDEVYDLLKNNRKSEARARVDAYRSRFPGFDTDKLDKISREIDVW